MAGDDEQRRVEPRGAIVGSGMLTEPDRIRDLESEAARRERAWREAPKAKFGEVLPPRKVLRLWQVENKLDTIIDAQLVKDIPLAR